VRKGTRAFFIGWLLFVLALNAAAASASDLGGDGKSDLLWYRPATGDTAYWMMNGATYTSAAVLLSDPNWKVVATGDLNGDGKADVIWYNGATGQTAYWMMNGPTATASGVLLTDDNWKLAATGDLNGDGKSDLIWYNAATGQTAYWMMNGATYTSSGILLTDANWRVTATADLNGDGKSDLIWYSAATGQTAYWMMNGSTATASGVLLTDASWKPVSALGLDVALYVGYYAEDPITNPEDPTVGALFFALPPGEGNFGGAMFFTFAGCQTNNVGSIAGTKSGSGIVGSWSGVIDAISQSGSFTGASGSGLGAFSGSYTVTGGKQFVNVPGCIQYYVAPQGTWQAMPVGTGLPSTFALSVAGTSVTWTNPPGTALAWISVIDEDEATAGISTALKYQTTSPGATPFNLATVGGLTASRTYVVTVTTTAANLQRTGVASARVVR